MVLGAMLLPLALAAPAPTLGRGTADGRNSTASGREECNLVAYGSNSISILMSVTGRSEAFLCERCWPITLTEHVRIYSVFADVWEAPRCLDEEGGEVPCPAPSGMICELVEDDCLLVDRREGTPTLYTREPVSGVHVSNYSGCGGGATECPYPKPAQVYLKSEPRPRPSDPCLPAGCPCPAWQQTAPASSWASSLCLTGC